MFTSALIPLANSVFCIMCWDFSFIAVYFKIKSLQIDVENTTCPMPLGASHKNVQYWIHILLLRDKSFVKYIDNLGLHRHVDEGFPSKYQLYFSVGLPGLIVTMQNL